MNGVAIILDLLRGDAAVTGAVQPALIKAVALPENFTPPGIIARSISIVDTQMLKRATKRRTTERVQVSVIAANYRDKTSILALVRSACADRVGDFAGAERCAVTTAGGGPDLIGPSGLFEQAQDFKVSFEIPA